MSTETPMQYDHKVLKEISRYGHAITDATEKLGVSHLRLAVAGAMAEEIKQQLKCNNV